MIFLSIDLRLIKVTFSIISLNNIIQILSALLITFIIQICANSHQAVGLLHQSTVKTVARLYVNSARDP